MPVKEWPADSIEAGIIQCVTACDALVKVSEDCADACLAIEGDGEVTDCFLADQDCVEICTTTARVLSWRTRSDGPTAISILETCRKRAGSRRRRASGCRSSTPPGRPARWPAAGSATPAAGCSPS